jgi:hypothetical protein
MSIETAINNKIKEFQANIVELEGLMAKIEPERVASSARAIYRNGINENIKNIRLLEEILKEGKK